jgi:hypothetical protein
MSRHFFKVPAAGENQPKIRADQPATADPLKFLLFDNSQQHGLHFERQIFQFIQKHCAVMGLLKFGICCLN